MPWTCEHFNAQSDSIVNVWRTLGSQEGNTHFYRITEEQIALWYLQGKTIRWAEVVGGELR